MPLRFADFEIDTGRQELRRSGEVVHMEPQVFDLLLHLVRNRERTVSKDELFEAIWQGRIVSEAALSSRINAARKAIGDNGNDQIYIRTLHKRGFRFVGAVTDASPTILRPSETVSEASRETAPGSPEAAGSGPSIAVLPFANMNSEAEQDYLADGITEDITTALARLRWLFVIARNSTLAYKGKAVDVRQVSRELGVRYLLEGSIRTAGQRIRITSQLIDAESGKHIWAQKYDRELRDIFAVQDEITEHVVAAVEPHLYAEEGFRASNKQPESIGTWELVVRALTLLNKLEHKEHQEAQDLLRRAIAREPNYARAHALLSWSMWWGTLCYWYPEPDGTRQAAMHAQEALTHDPTDPWARMVSGLCLSTAGQHDRALDELTTALRLNPSFALGHMAFGWALLRAGGFDDAIDETRKALRMSPLDSFSGLYTLIHGLALLAAERFEEALPFLRNSVGAYTQYTGPLNTLISCCGHLCLLGEAKELIAWRNRIGPPLRLSLLRHNLDKFAHRDVFVEGLRKAGVPE